MHYIIEIYIEIYIAYKELWKKCLIFLTKSLNHSQASIEAHSRSRHGPPRTIASSLYKLSRRTGVQQITRSANYPGSFYDLYC